MQAGAVPNAHAIYPLVSGNPDCNLEGVFLSGLPILLRTPQVALGLAGSVVAPADALLVASLAARWVRWVLPGGNRSIQCLLTSRSALDFKPNQNSKISLDLGNGNSEFPEFQIYFFKFEF